MCFLNTFFRPQFEFELTRRWQLSVSQRAGSSCLFSAERIALTLHHMFSSFISQSAERQNGDRGLGSWAEINPHDETDSSAPLFQNFISSSAERSGGVQPHSKRRPRTWLRNLSTLPGVLQGKTVMHEKGLMFCFFFQGQSKCASASRVARP